MVTYEEALKKARQLKTTIDNCTEYENGFVFGSMADGLSDGTNTPCVILKENGDAVNMPWFVISGMGREIRSFSVE